MDAGDAAEALTLATAYDNRNVTRSAAEAWALAMPDTSLADAKAAIVNHYTRTSDFIMPSHILDEVKLVRRQRLDDALANGGMRIAPPESIDPDDWAAQQQWTRTFRAALADGNPLDVADAIACDFVGATRPQIEASRPVAQLVENVARSMPRVPRKGDAA